MSINKDENHFLPDGWESVTIGDVCYIVRGITFPATVKGSQKFADNIACLRTANIQELIDWNNLIYVPKSYVKGENRLVLENDILISMANSRELVGKVAIVDHLTIESTFGGFIAAIRIFNGFEPKYLFYYLRLSETQEKLRKTANQTVNIANLSLDEIYATTFPFAPLPEQCRIVAAIEQQFTRLDAAVEALKQARKKLKLYRSAILKAAVEGKLTEDWRVKHPAIESATKLLKHILQERRAKWETDQLAKMAARGVVPRDDKWKSDYKEPAKADIESLLELPEGWCWATVEQLITFLRNGLSQRPESSPPGYKILRINAVRPMQVNLGEIRYLPLTAQEVEGYFIENEDILFTRYNGSLELLGVAGKVRGCFSPTLHPDKLIRVKTVLSEPLTSYVELACNIGISRAFIEGRARTTAGQKGISGSDIKQTPIPLPPLAEQEQIVALVEEQLSIISELEMTVEHSLRRAERERQSILQAAFAGRLVAQDPEDEPASVLLERIREERERREREGREAKKQRGNQVVNDVRSEQVLPSDVSTCPPM